MTLSKSKGVKEKYKFGDTVMVRLNLGVVIGVTNKTKWTYYDIVFQDFIKRTDDWDNDLVNFYTIREDNL